MLSGGKGADVFVFTEADFGPGPDDDVITDFGSSDRIDLRAFDTSFRALLRGDGPVSLSVDSDDTILTFASGTVRIEGVTHLHANDFIL